MACIAACDESRTGTEEEDGESEAPCGRRTGRRVEAAAGIRTEGVVGA